MEIPAAFEDQKRPARKLEKDCIKKCRDRRREKSFKLKAGSFRLDI